MHKTPLHRKVHLKGSSDFEAAGQRESNKESENAQKITQLKKSVKEMAEKIKQLQGELAKNKISTEIIQTTLKKSILLLCDHIHDVHVEKEEGSECHGDKF